MDKAPVGKILTDAIASEYPGFFTGAAEDCGKVVGEVATVMGGAFLVIAQKHGKGTAKVAIRHFLEIIQEEAGVIANLAEGIAPYVLPAPSGGDR